MEMEIKLALMDRLVWLFQPKCFKKNESLCQDKMVSNRSPKQVSSCIRRGVCSPLRYNDCCLKHAFGQCAPWP